MNVSSLHNEAMDIAEKAFSEKRADSGKAADLFSQACKLEKQAALLAKQQKASEKTVAVLLRSAASLAVNAGNYIEVKSLVELALSGNPSADIKAELDVLLDNIKNSSTRKYDSFNKIDDAYESVVEEDEVKYKSGYKEKQFISANAGDDELVNELRKGNQQALKELFNRHYRKLASFVNKIVENQKSAEEIASGSFAKLWVKKETFDSITGVKGFLYITARNASLNSLRIQRKIIKSNDEYLQLLEKKEDADILNCIIEPGIIASIYKALDKLPPITYSVFSLLYIEGLSIKEVSEQLNMPVRKVSNEKRNAIALLKNYLIS